MSSHTQLLLDTLSINLPNESLDLIKESKWKDTALDYLEDLLNSDNAESLLNTKIKPDNDITDLNSNGFGGIVEQIAELSNSAIILDNKILNSLNSNSNSNLSLILNSNSILNDSFDNYDNLILVTKDLVDINLISNWKSEISIINTNLGIVNNTTNDNSNDNELSLILKNLQNLIEIMELPSITHSLIKLGQYSECIEISALVKRLKIRYNDIDLIIKIEDKITYEINDMVKKLSSLLITNLKQSSTIKILSYLKRIINDKDHLKSIYLQSRFKFIMDEFDTLLPLKQSNLIEKYLKRSLEIFREFCFQTIITFDSIFDKDKSLTYSFIKALINRLSIILNENLPLINSESTKDSLLLQLIYCCQSLSRVGGDFTTLLIQRLSKTVETNHMVSIVKKQKNLVRSLNRV